MPDVRRTIHPRTGQTGSQQAARTKDRLNMPRRHNSDLEKIRVIGRIVNRSQKNGRFDFRCHSRALRVHCVASMYLEPRPTGFGTKNIMKAKLWM
jgi:hypothetical protein